MKVAALQFDVRADDWAANLAAVERGLEQAVVTGVRLVVLPEMWPTSFPTGDGDLEEAHAATEAALARVCALSRTSGLVVCGSAWGRGPDGPTNRLHVVEAGELRAVYDKVHLFSPAAEPESFCAGDDPPPVVDTCVGRLAGVTCYDLRFPEIVRVAFRGGAELLVVPAQWPAPRAAHWRVLAQGRAVESQAFVVGANRTGRAVVGRRRLELEFPGNSLIVDPHGTVLAEGRGEEGLIVAEVDLDLVRRLRVRVPIAKDERPDLYERWGRSSR